jgi:rubrerythrin
MRAISRRQFIFISTALWLSSPLNSAPASSEDKQPDDKDLFPITIAVLNSAYRSEIIAFEHYVGYSRKALTERYPNIAYLFAAFAVSEKTHADNYKRVLASLRPVLEEPEFKILISSTKKNLIRASKGELQKIKRTYPDFLAKLKKESYDQAVINCMYSWKSHRQHERKISQIQQFSKLFFGPVAKKIEGMKFDFHVCEICGSTLDEAPNSPCVICNYPILHYHRVQRPV